MDVKLLSVLCLLLLTGLVRGAAVGKNNEAIKDEDEDIYGDLGDSDTPKDEARDAEYYDETDDDKKIGQSTLVDNNDINVKLVSKSEHLAKNIGDLVRFPCQVEDKKADVIRSWYRNGQALYQGPVAVNKIDNIRLNSSSLEVKIVDSDDFGEYNCTLFLREHMNPNVVHTVFPPEVPRILKLETNTNSTQFREGDTLTLTCRASGNPKPKISWFRHNERLASGEQLSFVGVSRKEDGTYRCLADNRIGTPAHGHISIHVQRKPSIDVENIFVNSGHKHQAELICHVDAEPRAAINWRKNGVVIPDDVTKYGRTSENKKNVLLIKNIDESDFDEYSCHARNVYGETEKSINVVKLPVVQEFQKPANSSKEIILTWKVESKQPISHHELQYRKKGEDRWITKSPQVADPQNDVYLIKQTLSGLEPGIYETRARSHNDHGWSNYSDIMPFEGVKHGSQHQKKHKNKDKNEKDISEKPAKRIKETPVEDLSEKTTQRTEETPVGATTSSTWTPVSSLAVLMTAIFMSMFVQHRP